MTRRDTILMAVLINAGLLVILFATAITQDPPPPQNHLQAEAVSSVQETVPSQAMTTLLPVAMAPLPRAAQAQDLDTLVTQYAASPEVRPVVAEVISFSDGIVPVAHAPAAPAPVRAANPVETPPVPRSATQSHSGWVEITVKRGDTLDKIARANGTSVANLMEFNALASTRLQIGDVLKIPQSAASTAHNVALAVPSTPAPGEFYTVRSGDNPWVVAMKFHVPLDELLKLNDLDEDGARKLKPGDKIRIR